MRHDRIRGEIICSCRDEYGDIFVVDHDSVRSLFFGTEVVQSSISPERREVLLDDHCRAMVSSLIFNPRPASVLMIGLGGCSIVNFFLTAFPGIRLDVVELRQKVIDLAYQFFLPKDTGKSLTVFHSPGQEFIRNAAGGYDLIIVDAFDDEGPAAPLAEKDFIHSCRERLNNDGIFLTNLWNRPKDGFDRRFGVISDVFEGNALKLLLPGIHQNVIVFGSTDPSRFRNLAGLRKVARGLQSEYGIDFPKYLSNLCWLNVG